MPISPLLQAILGTSSPPTDWDEEERRQRMLRAGESPEPAPLRLLRELTRQMPSFRPESLMGVGQGPLTPTEARMTGQTAGPAARLDLRNGMPQFRPDSLLGQGQGPWTEEELRATGQAPRQTQAQLSVPAPPAPRPPERPPVPSEGGLRDSVTNRLNQGLDAPHTPEERLAAQEFLQSHPARESRENLHRRNLRNIEAGGNLFDASAAHGYRTEDGGLDMAAIENRSVPQQRSHGRTESLYDQQRIGGRFANYPLLDSIERGPEWASPRVRNDALRGILPEGAPEPGSPGFTQYLEGLGIRPEAYGKYAEKPRVREGEVMLADRNNDGRPELHSGNRPFVRTPEQLAERNQNIDRMHDRIALRRDIGQRVNLGQQDPSTLTEDQRGLALSPDSREANRAVSAGMRSAATGRQAPVQQLLATIMEARHGEESPEAEAAGLVAMGMNPVQAARVVQFNRLQRAEQEAELAKARAPLDAAKLQVESNERLAKDELADRSAARLAEAEQQERQSDREAASRSALAAQEAAQRAADREHDLTKIETAADQDRINEEMLKNPGISRDEAKAIVAGTGATSAPGLRSTRVGAETDPAMVAAAIEEALASAQAPEQVMPELARRGLSRDQIVAYMHSIKNYDDDPVLWAQNLSKQARLLKAIGGNPFEYGWNIDVGSSSPF